MAQNPHRHHPITEDYAALRVRCAYIISYYPKLAIPLQAMPADFPVGARSACCASCADRSQSSGIAFRSVAARSYRLHFVPLSVPAPRRYSCGVLKYLSLLCLILPCLRQGAAAAAGESIPDIPLKVQVYRLPVRHSPARAARSHARM